MGIPFGSVNGVRMMPMGLITNSVLMLLAH